MTRRHLLLGLLLASVAINLFFVGAIGYRMLRLDAMREARPLPPNLGWIIRDLSEARREQLAPSLREGAVDILPLRRDIFSAQRQVNELIAAPDFDADALSAAFRRLREASEHYQQATQQQTVAILNELTVEERQSVLDFVRRRGPRDGHPGPDGGPRPPRPGDRFQEPAQ